MKNNPLLMTDGYKTSHHLMYPKDTTLVYSNFTPRNVKYMDPLAKDILVFGAQYMIKYVHELYRDEFFNKPKDEVVGEAKAFLSSYLGCDYDVSHFEKLHDLGYLPIQIKSLKEGTVSGVKVPILTIFNTHRDFFWLPNFLETLISSLLWKPLHSASLSYGLKKMLVGYAKETDINNLGFVDFQGHDFSFRGMQHPESAISSGLGFMVNFSGTDTIPVLKAAKHYYNSENVGFSVPASEHAVMTAYGKENEIDAFRRIMIQFTSGIVSIVSDSFDLFKVCTVYLPMLKKEILARDGKLVIRPDSGDPVDIICGEAIIGNLNYDGTGRAYPDNPEIGDNWHNVTWKNGDKYYKLVGLPHHAEWSEIEPEPKHKGVIELLWDVFGGTINEQGYKVLDSHIGAILGDGVTLERAKQICERLKAKGFASTNIVLGIGSYSMGYCTRDNQGSAVKATYVEVDGEGREIFKDPITDDGTKKSAKGLLRVDKDENGNYVLTDCVTWEQEAGGCLETIYKDGEFFNPTTLTEIRERLKNQ